MIKKELSILSILSLVFLLLLSCETKDSDGKGTFEREILLENIAANLIIPSYQQFSESSQELLQATNNFTQTPNEENLLILQTAWKQASEDWNKCETYNYFGPVVDSSFVTRLNNFPTDPSSIESKISSTDDLSSSYLESQSSKVKGLPAIEYLIFSPDGNAAVVSSFQSERRTAYLTALSENLNEKATSLNSSWAAYESKFLSSTGSDAGGSTNLLVNSMIQAVEQIKNIKIGEPFGKKSTGGIKPDKVEALYSSHSLALIKADLTAIEKTFLGKKDTTDGIGFDDYLDHVNAKWQDNQLLSERIKQQFANINTAIDEITVPLDQAVSTQPDQVEKVYNALTSLISLLKGEMVSKLGLSVTYSDNDGD